MAASQMPPDAVVHGRLADSAEYESLHPRFAKAFEFLRSHDLAALPDGRCEIDGDDIYANVMEITLAPWDADAELEVHRRYIDIHVPIDGDELAGFVHDEGHAGGADFNEKDDCVLFRDPRMSRVLIRKGEFAIFRPNSDAHAPGKTCGEPCRRRKLVVKVRNAF